MRVTEERAMRRDFEPAWRDAEFVMAQPLIDPCSAGVIDAEPCPRALGREIAPGRRRIVLAACILASSMAFIDGTALTVALPKLRAAVGADLASVQWVLNGYVLALASLTLIGGALADAQGKARMLSIGCLLFGAASAGCALAPSVDWLIAVRVCQGIAAALLTPASLALIGATYPKEERNHAIGAWAAASALTTAAGPILGGWLTETFGWQSIFWINPPIAVAAVALLRASAPEDQLVPRRFDFVGAAIVAAALGALAWALSQIGGSRSPSATSLSADAALLVLALLGIGGLVLYARWERRTTHPMTPPRLAANSLFLALNVATLFIYAGLAIFFFLLPFDLVDRRGLPPIEAGLAFLPFSVSVGLLSTVFGRVADKIGAKAMLVLGPFGAALAYAWLALGQDMSEVAGVIAPITLLGISFAVLIAPLTASVMSSVEKSDEGLASGVNNAASRVAQLGGVALAAGLGSIAAGYTFGLAASALLSIAGALTIVFKWPRTQAA
jgi:EmrB/QacA subfamily drug resistance transporter